AGLTKPPATSVRSATSTGDDVDRATPSGGERAVERDPIVAAGDEGEPVPMSLDQDAGDRTFDRLLAYLGLLDDAAPLFRDGSSVPGAGVLLALPCLLESGLLRISRRLYGEIGPAFYGLRTTLLTLLVMALLRIERPEHLKERDAALTKALARLLREVRDVVGERRVTIVFDRGGWSPKLFSTMIKDGFDVLTYRKGRCRRIHERRFIRRRAELDGRWVDFLLHDQPVGFLKGKLRLRQVTRLCDNGHQTQVITSRWDPRDSEVADRL